MRRRDELKLGRALKEHAARYGRSSPICASYYSPWSPQLSSRVIAARDGDSARHAAVLDDDPLSYRAASVEVTHVKLAAAFKSPLPLYFGQLGYSQSGRVRPFVASLRSVTICTAGDMPCSTHASSADNESQAAIKAAGLAGPCPKPGTV